MRPLSLAASPITTTAFGPYRPAEVVSFYSGLLHALDDTRFGRGDRNGRYALSSYLRRASVERYVNTCVDKFTEIETTDYLALRITQQGLIEEEKGNSTHHDCGL